MRLLIVGDSHTSALEMGRAAAVGTSALPADIEWSIRPFGPGRHLHTQFWEPRGDHALITNEEYAQRVRRLPPKGSQFDAIGLSMPMWHGRVMREFLDAGMTLPGLGGEGQVVSEALFRHIVLSDQKPSLDLAVFLRGLGYPVFAIEPPTVFRVNHYLSFFAPERVLGVVAAHRAVAGAALRRNGIPLVERPRNCADKDGFMWPEYKAKDPSDRHHGNAKFGIVMLSAIAARLPELCQDPVASA